MKQGQETVDEGLAREAAQAIAEAEALLIGAGAGMGVDSGLPDFRGNQGFWRAYPPFQRLGLSFIDLANPQWFFENPQLAWGFYGHRLLLYRQTVPHPGFALLFRWAQEMAAGAFVYTSNVDGQFRKAGFSPSQVVECHGSIHHLQCSRACTSKIWSAQETEVDIDEETFHAAMPLPLCPHCGAIARPNILMFADGEWLSERTDRQEAAYYDWLSQLKGKRLVIVECGAGGAIPTVRFNSERYLRLHQATLIRINPREAQGPSGTLSFPHGAHQALRAIEEARTKQ